jgi:aminoglycoside 2''-phosphotransferase
MDIQLYRRAVAEQFPQLDLSGFRLLGEGGGSWVFETDCKLVWRFLKRPDSAECLDLEIRLLPELADAVSLPLPRYEYISNRAISPRFVGYRKIHGVAFDHERLAACCSDRPLRQLAQFLTELHCFPIERAQAAGLTLPTSDECRAEWLHRRNQIHQHVFPLLDERQHAWAMRTLSDLLSDNALLDYTPTLCHGDLWAEHILFDPARETLTGVIDWESASLGDPARDWAALWLDHGDDAIERLFANYRVPVNATWRQRMMLLARHVPLNEILCGVLYDDRASWQDGWERMGRIVG